MTVHYVIVRGTASAIFGIRKTDNNVATMIKVVATRTVTRRYQIVYVHLGKYLNSSMEVSQCECETLRDGPTWRTHSTPSRRVSLIGDLS